MFDNVDDDKRTTRIKKDQEDAKVRPKTTHSPGWWVCWVHNIALGRQNCQVTRNICRETLWGPSINNRGLDLTFGFPLDNATMPRLGGVMDLHWAFSKVWLCLIVWFETCQHTSFDINIYKHVGYVSYSMLLYCLEKVPSCSWTNAFDCGTHMNSLYVAQSGLFGWFTGVPCKARYTTERHPEFPGTRILLNFTQFLRFCMVLPVLAFDSWEIFNDFQLSLRSSGY